MRIAIELAINNFAMARRQESAGKVVPWKKMPERPVPDTADKETVLQMNDYIFVKNNYVFVKIKLPDLLYIEADNNYVNVMTQEKNLCCDYPLASYWKRSIINPGTHTPVLRC